jgi:hypothetical protein
MKWIKKLTEYTAYVSQCANAISKGVAALSDNWPSDNPFSRSAPVVDAKKGLAKVDQAQRVQQV